MLNAEGFQVVAEVAEGVEGVDEGETEREDEAEQGGDDEGHDLVVGEAGGEETYRDERRAEEEQAEVGAPGAAHVDVAHGISDPIDGDDIDERRKQGDNQ